MPVDKQIINPASFVKPSGYANGVVTQGGRLVMLAGQTALDGTGSIVAVGDIVGQFRQALTNLQTVLTEAGGQMTDIVKLTLYVTDKRLYQQNARAIGGVYRDLFGKYYPAMTLVEIKSLWDDTALLEIDGIAVIEER